MTQQLLESQRENKAMREAYEEKKIEYESRLSQSSEEARRAKVKLRHQEQLRGVLEAQITQYSRTDLQHKKQIADQESQMLNMERQVQEREVAWR